MLLRGVVSYWLGLSNEFGRDFGEVFVRVHINDGEVWQKVLLRRKVQFYQEGMMSFL